MVRTAKSAPYLGNVGSNLRKVGRGSKGCEAPLVDGMVPRKGSAKAPLLGRDEIVSMKWSWGHRG